MQRTAPWPLAEILICANLPEARAAIGASRQNKSRSKNESENMLWIAPPEKDTATQ